MEEKKDAFNRCFRSLFSRGNISKLFLFSRSSSKDHGFTIIELLIVMAVVGVLASGVIVLINPVAQMNRSKDGKTKADLKQIQGALELYRSDCGSYPAPASGGTIPNPLTSTCVSSTPTTYMQNVPTGPQGAYTYTLSGSTYTLTGCAMDSNLALNSTSDPKVIASSCSSGKALQVTNP